MSETVPEQRSIYLDHNATTPVAPEVIEAVCEALRDGWGNPGSAHPFGQRARVLVEEACEQVAMLIGARPDEIVFVSGGTEANDLAICGTAGVVDPGTVVISSIEHPAVLEAAASLPSVFTVQQMAAGPDGRVVLPDALPKDTRLVSLMLANNETGVLQPVAELARLARAVPGARVHTDAAQAVGKIPVDVDALSVDLLSIAGHKLYAPKGIGALYVRAKTTLAPRLRGGGQQRGVRGGTEPVPGIVGLGRAAQLARETLAAEGARQRALRDDLIAGLRARIEGLVWTAEGAGAHRCLPNTAHLRFPGVSGRALLDAARVVAASTGSACHAGVDHASPVLLAMGIAQAEAMGAVRLSIGRGTTRSDIEEVVGAIASAYGRVRGEESWTL